VIDVAGAGRQHARAVVVKQRPGLGCDLVLMRFRILAELAREL
jgi:hypothetical protein